MGYADKESIDVIFYTLCRGGSCFAGTMATPVFGNLANKPHFFTGSSVNERFLVVWVLEVLALAAGFVVGVADGLVAR